MNHDARDQLDWLSQVLSQNVFTQKQSSDARGSSSGEVPDSEDGLPGNVTFPERVSGARIEIRPDPTRERRKGVPEVIFAETKTTSQVIAMARSLLEATGRAIISRVRSEMLLVLQREFRSFPMRVRETSHALVIYQPDYTPVRTGGHVGVLSAGTSDVPVADEAVLIAEEMGCKVSCIYDVGVAGLHRLLEPLSALLTSGVDVLIVAAGMDGALPSVVAGLVPVPVIGLPTSVGYGLGGNGVAALLSMLQTCAPGLSVVNIDNGIGAGSTAALIANRVALAAEHQSQ